MGNLATAMFIVYHVFFGIGWASTPWIYSAEVNSLGWRTRGAAAATATNWLFGFVVTQFTKAGVDNLGWRLFLSKYKFVRNFLPSIRFLTKTSQCLLSLRSLSSPWYFSFIRKHQIVPLRIWTICLFKTRPFLYLESRT